MLHIGAPLWSKHHIFTSRTATYLFSPIYHSWLGTITSSRSQEGWWQASTAPEWVCSPDRRSEGQGWSGWQSGFTQLLVRTPHLELVTGNVRVIPSQLPKGPNSHHSEKIRIPNEKSFTAALAFHASLLLLLITSTPSAFCRISPPTTQQQTPYSTQGWQSLLTDWSSAWGVLDLGC